MAEDRHFKEEIASTDRTLDVKLTMDSHEMDVYMTVAKNRDALMKLVYGLMPDDVVKIAAYMLANVVTQFPTEMGYEHYAGAQFLIASDLCQKMREVAGPPPRPEGVPEDAVCFDWQIPSADKMKVTPIVPNDSSTIN